MKNKSSHHLVLIKGIINVISVQICFITLPIKVDKNNHFTGSTDQKSTKSFPFCSNWENMASDSSDSDSDDDFRHGSIQP